MPRFIRKRVFKNFEAKNFRQGLADSQLKEVLDCNDVNEATECFEDKLTMVLDSMAPLRTIQIRTKYAPWLSEETKNLMARRNAAQEKASQTDHPEDWRQFKSLRNQVKSRSRWEKKSLDDKLS